MTVLEKQLTIVNKLGLHARAATKLAQLSKQFDAKITLSLDGKAADASSIMALMLLAGGQGKQVSLQVEGEDAQAALNAVSQLINDKFEEAE
jgi:phosphocarrier protein NPr